VVQDARVETSSERLERTYREIGPNLWRSLVAYTGQRDMADDIVAETFAQALARGDQIRDLGRWVWTAAFRIAAGELKQRGWQRSEEIDVRYEMPETLVDVLAAVAKLPPKQRIAVVLHDYADRPTREVAQILGVTSATVHVHLSQGRRRLRALLEDRDA
jgi:RNA polymerase sigma-70 factor, ECF subfamily